MRIVHGPFFRWRRRKRRLLLQLVENVSRRTADLAQNVLELFKRAALTTRLNSSPPSYAFTYERRHQSVNRNVVGLCKFRSTLVKII